MDKGVSRRTRAGRAHAQAAFGSAKSTIRGVSRSPRAWGPCRKRRARACAYRPCDLSFASGFARGRRAPAPVAEPSLRLLFTPPARPSSRFGEVFAKEGGKGGGAFCQAAFFCLKTISSSDIIICGENRKEMLTLETLDRIPAPLGASLPVSGACGGGPAAHGGRPSGGRLSGRGGCELPAEHLHGGRRVHPLLCALPGRGRGEHHRRRAG